MQSGQMPISSNPRDEALEPVSLAKVLKADGALEELDVPRDCLHDGERGGQAVDLQTV